MTTSEKFCLRWNDFQQNIVSAFHGLRQDVEYSDVTLACEDDQQIEAHRIILTASSPFFSKVLQRNKHSHPIIYMRGLKAKDLVAMVDFIYLGEANIYQEDLDGFLALAEELQLKGLSGQQEPEEITEKYQQNYFSKSKRLPQEETTFDTALMTQDPTAGARGNATVPVKTVVALDPYTDDLKAQISSMIEDVNDGIHNRQCKVCQKTTKIGTRIRVMERHIETHLEGISHTCSICGKVSMSSAALSMHLSRYHRK